MYQRPMCIVSVVPDERERVEYHTASVIRWIYKISEISKSLSAKKSLSIPNTLSLLMVRSSQRQKDRYSEREMNDTSQEIGQRIEHSTKLQAASHKVQGKITISNEKTGQKYKIIQAVNQGKKGLDHVEDTDEDKTESNAQIYSKITKHKNTLTSCVFLL